MWKNKIKTCVLLSVLGGLFMAVGWFCGGGVGMALALLMAIVMQGVAYFYSDRIVLALYGAQSLDKFDYAFVNQIVEELSSVMGLPMPRLWIIHTPVANAFATGRNPENSSIVLTTGILRILDVRELRGVLAHEMSHIYNRDVLVTSVAAVFATALGYVASMARHYLFWGAVRGSSSNKKSSSSYGSILGMVIVAVLMPLAAMIIQLSISRSREYLADETGAHACQDPLALAAALEKLHTSTQSAHFQTDDATAMSTASLFIVHPFLKSNGFFELFLTHPPVEKRVEKLRMLWQSGVGR